MATARKQTEWVSLKVAVERTGLNQPKLERMIKSYQIATRRNPRDLRERLVDFEALKRILEE